MEHTSIRYVYHDGLAHYDKEAWLEVGDFAGWVVVECNCTLVTHSAVVQRLRHGLHTPEMDVQIIPALHTEEE